MTPIQQEISNLWDDMDKEMDPTNDLEITIIVNCVYPPIPVRSMDWQACTSNYDGPGSPLGHGPTKWDAIRGLIDQLEMRDDK